MYSPWLARYLWELLKFWCPAHLVKDVSAETWFPLATCPRRSNCFPTRYNCASLVTLMLLNERWAVHSNTSRSFSLFIGNADKITASAFSNDLPCFVFKKKILISACVCITCKKPVNSCDIEWHICHILRYSKTLWTHWVWGKKTDISYGALSYS